MKKHPILLVIVALLVFAACQQKQPVKQVIASRWTIEKAQHGAMKMDGFGEAISTQVLQ